MIQKRSPDTNTERPAKPISLSMFGNVFFLAVNQQNFSQNKKWYAQM